MGWVGSWLLAMVEMVGWCNESTCFVSVVCARILEFLCATSKFGEVTESIDRKSLFCKAK